nr:unnamed protein product [Callosobruchus chinensis]
MDDNARPHRTRAVQQALENGNIVRLEWPAMSPNMNPIEHVWDYVSRAIFNRNNPPRSTQELIVAATEEWENIPQEKTIFIIEFSAPAEVNIVSKEEEKRTKYQELLGQLRRLWPDYAVSLLVMVIGSLGGMRNTLLSALRTIPVCRAAAHILAARMQTAVIPGSLRLLRGHDSRTQ